MSDVLEAQAIGFLDEQLLEARAVLARTVDRVDALRELLDLAVEQQAELRRSPTLNDLLSHWPTETQRARIVALLNRCTEGESR